MENKLISEQQSCSTYPLLQNQSILYNIRVKVYYKYYFQRNTQLCTDIEVCTQKTRLAGCFH